MPQARRGWNMATSVALSGGGHRASLFGLGVLLYLADHEENKAVSSIASVSGGSITNGYLAKTIDFRTASSEEVREAMRPMAQILARQGTFMGPVKPKVVPMVVGNVVAAIAAFIHWPGTGDWRVLRLVAFLVVAGAISYACLGRSLITVAGRAYATLLAPSAVTALILPFILPGASGLGWTLLRLAGAVVLLLLWVEVVLRLRGPVCLHTFRATLFPEMGGKAPLASVGHEELAHVFCATELQTGDQVYLSPTFLYSYQLGVGAPHDLDLASAVQASASLPGAFPAQRQPTAPFNFAYPSATKPDPDDRAVPFPSQLVLVDGGVYDNMGDEWGQGYAPRADIWPDVEKHCAPPERLVVVQASGGKRFSPMAKPWFPAMSEVQAVSADKDVLYDQTTAQRRRGLVAQFQNAERTGKGLTGALVYISQSPYRVPDQMIGTPSREGAARAIDRLDKLGVSREEWKVLTRKSQGVKTTLAALGDVDSALLIWHAYVLAAVNLHVLLNFPIPDVLPTRAVVEQWLAGGTWAGA